MEKKIIKKLLSVLLLFGLLIIMGCASMNPYSLSQKDNNYKITQRPAINNISVSFDGPDYLWKLEEERARRELRQPREVGNIAIISIRINGPSYNTANGRDAVFILQDNSGNELYRDTRKNLPSSYDGSGGQSLYTSFESIGIILDGIDFPLSLRVVHLGNITDVIITER